MRSDLTQAIQTGDLDTLNRLISADPSVVQARPDGQRTLLHIATDWPGHFPKVRETISALVTHGADVNAAFQGTHSETPLHWAASNNDVDALQALLDHGANLEAPGAVIGGGTPLADAVVFGQWQAARVLIERGARVTLWQASALGLIDRVDEILTGDTKPSGDDITNAFWNACRGGQLETAKRLGKPDAGVDAANLNWVGHDDLTPLDAAIQNGNQELVNWLRSQGAMSAKDNRTGS